MTARTVPVDELSSIAAPTGPPGRSRLLGEIGTLIQPTRLALSGLRLGRAPRGDGRRAVLIPGWKSPELAMVPIGTYLRRLGHDTQGWGLGVNDADVEQTRDRMLERVPELVAETGRPVNLIGWSLGGVIAREIARSLPDAVHRVVTYGTPVLGGPTHTVGAASAGRAECNRITELQEHLDATDPIRVPITAIYTRNDGAVDWRACIDRSSLDVRMVEVGSTHVGLGLDPDVWLTAAKALAE
ncbi:MAG: hypothetical protein AAF962_11045 [Actinomycetota bacterium]